MASEEEEDFLRERAYRHANPNKSNIRIFSFILQAIIMAILLSVFFIFLGVAAVLLLHIFLAGRALSVRRLQRTRSSQIGHKTSNSGLFPGEIERIACFIYDSSDVSDCSVCLEGFRKGDRCRILPYCNHIFHVDCIDRWILKVPLCPICRSGIRRGAISQKTGGGDMDIGSQLRFSGFSDTVM